MVLAKENKITKNVIFILLLLIFIGLTGYLIFYQIVDHFAMTDPMLFKLKDHIAPLHPIVTSLSFYEGNKSYTINKQKIYLCLKDEKSDYYDFNMLVYVTIHELAHVLCPEVGHTQKFHEIFDQLLKEATELGIYDPTQPIIKNYCGHT